MPLQSSLPGSLVSSPCSRKKKNVVSSFKKLLYLQGELLQTSSACRMPGFSVVSAPLTLHRSVPADVRSGQDGSRPPCQCFSELKLLPITKHFRPFSPLPNLLSYVASFANHFSG